MQIVLILSNIRSNENVGSIFRTSDAAGVSKIYLSGYTPAPVDRFGRINKAISKAALGAEKFIEWEKTSNLSAAVKKLKKENYKIIGIEQDEKSINYRTLKPGSRKIALVFGNEVKGLSKKDLELCDEIVEIPMKGFLVREARHPRSGKRGKESLNVSVAAGIVLFQII